MSTPFEDAWASTSAAEGGYSNDPNDPGGETNHGITVAVARAGGYDGAMVDLTADQAAAIAKKYYWDSMRLESIAFLSRGVAAELFDTGFNMGQVPAVNFLQRALNALNRNGSDYSDIVMDGRMGDASVGALAHFLTARGKDGEHVLIALLGAQQACEYLRQVESKATKEKYLFGWILNRVLQPAE